MKMRLLLIIILITFSVSISFSKPKKKNVVDDYKFNYGFHLYEDETFLSRYNIIPTSDSIPNKKDCRFFANVKDSLGENLIGVNFTFYNDKNVEIGTVSDIDGNVDFLLPKISYQLVVSYVGFSKLVIDSLNLNKNVTKLGVVLGTDKHLDDNYGVRCKNRLTKGELDKIRQQMKMNIIPDKVKCKECQTYIVI